MNKDERFYFFFKLINYFYWNKINGIFFFLNELKNIFVE